MSYRIKWKKNKNYNTVGTIPITNRNERIIHTRFTMLPVLQNCTSLKTARIADCHCARMFKNMATLYSSWNRLMIFLSQYFEEFQFFASSVLLKHNRPCIVYIVCSLLLTVAIIMIVMVYFTFYIISWAHLDQSSKSAIAITLRRRSVSVSVSYFSHFRTGLIETKLGSNVTLALFKIVFEFQFFWKCKMAARPITCSY